jgi:hypothetical protein
MPRLISAVGGGGVELRGNLTKSIDNGIKSGPKRSNAMAQQCKEREGSPGCILLKLIV